MTLHNGTLLLTEDDSFEADPQKGSRLFSVLVPVSRKLEFERSPLARVLRECTNMVIFYTEIK